MADSTDRPPDTGTEDDPKEPLHQPAQEIVDPRDGHSGPDAPEISATWELGDG